MQGGGTGSGFESPMDVFDKFFEGARKNVIQQMKVSLEDLYNGTTRKVIVKRKVICVKCEGRGGKEGVVGPCTHCKGTGKKVRIHHLAPDMEHQVQSVCHECSGKGERIDPKLRCIVCMGKKVVDDHKIVEVHVDKGMKDGEIIRFSGEGDQEPGLEPGDIIIVFDELDHPRFRRHDSDLIMKMDLQLIEALCGFQKIIKTLDKRLLVITNLPGEVVKNDDIKCIMGEGMPVYRDPFTKGRLIIKMKIIFPRKDQLALDKLPEIEKCLPARTDVIVPDGAEEHTLLDYDPSELRRGRRGDAYEEDEDGMHGQRAQCASH